MSRTGSAPDVAPAAATEDRGRQALLSSSRAREFIPFAASTVLYQGSRFLFSLAAAWVLVPEGFTAWALVVAVLVYAPALLLGVANGMGRELPIHVGRGSHRAAARTVAAAWSAMAAAAVVILIVGALVAVASPEMASRALLVGTLVVGTVVFHTQQFILRSRLRFDAASVQQAAFGALALAASVVLVTLRGAGFEVTATLYGAALTLAVVIGLILSPPPIPTFDVDEIRRLAVIGLPIMAAGLVFSLFVTLDRWVAATLLGARAAAPYALASLLAAAMLVVPTVVSQQTYPRMAIARGRGASDDELRRMAARQGVLAVALVAPIAFGIAAFALIGVPVLLPTYLSAAPAVVVLSAGFLVLAWLTGYGNYLNVVGGQRRYLVAQLIGVLVGIVLMVAGGLTLGLSGIAIGTALGHVAYGVVLRHMARRTNSEPNRIPVEVHEA